MAASALRLSLLAVLCLLGSSSTHSRRALTTEKSFDTIMSEFLSEKPASPVVSVDINKASEFVQKKLKTFESNKVTVDKRSLVIFNVGEANIKDSMEVAENNIKIFTSSITQHTSKATNQAVYLFNVIGLDNPLSQFIPTDNENVVVLKWDSSSSDMLTYTRTVELLGTSITEQFNSIVFLNQESRGPLIKRADGEWLGDFSRLLSVEKVGLAGASISCEVAPHVQTHTFAVKPAMIPTMSALIGEGIWDETKGKIEVELSARAKTAGFQIGSNLYSRRGNQDSFSKCLTPAEGSPKTVSANPTSWCDLKASEVTFQMWGGEPLRTNGFICETAKDNMHNTLVELQKAEPSLALTIPETLMGGHRFDMYQQYQQEVRVSGEVASVTADSDKVCFLVRTFDSSETAAQSQFIHYGLPSLISSLQKQNDPNWLAVFVNTDNRDYFSTLSATVGSYSDARLKTIDIPKEFRPAFTPADAGYTATDYALREVETLTQCKYITVTNSDNVYGTEVVQRVLAASSGGHKAPDMLLAPLDSRNFAYQGLSNRGLEKIYSSRCTEIMATMDFMHLAATAQPIPKLGKVDLASMFFNRVKLVQEKLNFNDVKSPICPGCQDGLMAEYLVQRRLWNYQRMPIDGLQSIVFHGPSPTLCIASGNVWFDYPKVNGVGCYNHSMVVTLSRDPAVNSAFDWGNFNRNDKMCLRLKENSFLNVATGQPMMQAAAKRKLATIHLEASVNPSEAPTDAPTVEPTLAPSQVPSAVPSATPSVEPSQVPSAAPSAVPSATPSVEPSQVPSAAPSVEPTQVPSVTPSVVPSVTPSVEPSVVPSAMPSMVPSARPSRSFTPTQFVSAMPTLADTTIGFDSSITLRNLTSNTLGAKDQEAVCLTATETLSLDSDQCTFLGQTPLTSRRMLATGSFSARVTIFIKASTTDFPETKNDTNGDALYAMLTTTLATSVNSKTFQSDLRVQSEVLGAEVTMFVADVEFTPEPYVVITGESDKDGDDLATGYFAGVVIGVILCFLLAGTIIWYFFFHTAAVPAAQPAKTAAREESFYVANESHEVVATSGAESRV